MIFEAASSKKENAKRIKTLKSARVKSIGIFETFWMKSKGLKDGMNGLPRRSENGSWYSPQLDREINAYEEFGSRVWGRSQIEQEDTYNRLSQLANEVFIDRKRLEKAEAHLTEETREVSREELSRKPGEEDMTDEQVKRRRLREQAKHLESYEREVKSLEEKIEKETEEIFTLYGKIAEIDNSTKMIVNRVKDHVFQRIDVYWEAALGKHAGEADIPIIPNITVTNQAENVYRNPHQDLIKTIEELRKERADKVSEADEQEFGKAAM